MRSSRGSRKRHSCREFDSSADRRRGDRSDHRGRDPGALLLQSSELALRRGHRPAFKKRARAISGGNHHFEFCSVLIYLCFQKGWTHDKFSIVQSVAGACYHMMLSAHLRGYATIWNAGIGDTEARSPTCWRFRRPSRSRARSASAGRSRPRPPMKAPRRSAGEVWSHQHVRAAGARDLSGQARRRTIRSSRISNARQSVRRMAAGKWGWDRIAIFAAMRSGRSRRSRASIARGDRARRPLPSSSLLPRSAPAARVVDVMPWGGTYTVELRRRFARRCALPSPSCRRRQSHLHRRAAAAGGRRRQPVDADLIKGGRLPAAGRQRRRRSFAVAGAGAHAGAGARCSTRSRACSSRAARGHLRCETACRCYGWSYYRASVARAGAEPGAVRAARRRSRSARMAGARFTIEHEAGHFACRPRAMATIVSGAAALRLARLCDARVEDRAMTASSLRRAARTACPIRRSITRPQLRMAGRCARCALGRAEHRALRVSAAGRQPRSVAAHAAPGRARLRRARLRQPRRPVAHVRRDGPTSASAAPSRSTSRSSNTIRQILEALREARRWDVMCHGLYNTRYHWNMAEDEERAAIAECVETWRRLPAASWRAGSRPPRPSRSTRPTSWPKPASNTTATGTTTISRSR